MIFERVPLAHALGGILAHSLQTADRVLRKGALVDAAAFALLQAAGFEAVTIARLEPGDMPEGEAASYLGELLLGPWAAAFAGCAWARQPDCRVSGFVAAGRRAHRAAEPD